MAVLKFLAILLAAVAITVSVVLPNNRNRMLSGTASNMAIRMYESYKHIRTAAPVHREKRQNDEGCDTAQIELYEHEHGDDCMSIFYNTNDPFFGSYDEDYVNTYCGDWMCGKWVPPLLQKIEDACGIDLLSNLGDLMASACKKDSRDYCLYKWEYLDAIMSFQNSSTLANNYGRCLSRNITDGDPCPVPCKSALSDIVDHEGCCYGELMAIKSKDGNPIIVDNDVFTDCNMTSIPRPCS